MEQPQRNFLQNQFIGNVRPIIPKRNTNPPVWTKELKIGEITKSTSNLWTTVRIYIREANFQYPKAGMFFSLSNGNRFCFTQLNKGDIGRLIDFLSSNIDECERTFGEKEQAATKLDQLIQNVREAQNLIEEER